MLIINEMIANGANDFTEIAQRAVKNIIEYCDDFEKLAITCTRYSKDSKTFSAITDLCENVDLNNLFKYTMLNESSPKIAEEIFDFIVLKIGKLDDIKLKEAAFNVSKNDKNWLLNLDRLKQLKLCKS
jgi:predicted dinucleotide-utilizing enzyme